MPEDQAEVLANGQADLYERLVTKEYFEFTLTHELEKLRVELKNDIETVKAELKHELDQHKAANKQALKELELTLKHELERHKAELKHDLETTKTELKRDIKEMEQKLTIKLGITVASPFYLYSTNSSERPVRYAAMPGSRGPSSFPCPVNTTRKLARWVQPP